MSLRLQASTSYTHGWEFFSKLLFLSRNIQSSKNILHLVSSSEITKKYKIIAQELSIPYVPISTYQDLLMLSYKEWSIYALDIESLWNELESDILKNPLNIEVGYTISMEDLMKKLQDLSYEFHEYEKNGSYLRKWDTIKITLRKNESYTISFWWDEIESIQNISGENISSLSLSSLQEIKKQEDTKTPLRLADWLSENKVFIVLDNLEFHHRYEELSSQKFISSSFDILPQKEHFRSHTDLAIENLSITTLEQLKKTLWNPKYEIHIYTRHLNTLQEFLRENSFSHISLQSVKTHLLSSFCIPIKQEKKRVYICDDILSKIFIKKRIRKKLSADIDLLLKIQNGDYIVHIDHGIWIFQWIIKKQLWNIEKEYLEISYQEKDKLFVPITEVHRVSKYIGSENPKLTPLSGKMWEKKMKKVHEDIREIAEWILKNFAERKLRWWKQNIYDEEKISDFQSKFPYSYTLDQETSIGEILSDMQSDKNMDRLLVWDVGFWKTEVAFNAAYMSLLSKKQVLLISPLVVLAHEHYSKALERFADFGIRIEVLTRLQSQKHASMVLKGLADGSIDMVVGTHRLLWEKLKCKNLWLMIVDEEHKFWVVDKEKIKNIRSDIDILSLSATPIPRSLNLALSGVRDISLLKTPPSWRKSIETAVIRYNEKLIEDAGKRELARGGQIFFVHNRVSNIEVVKKQLEVLFKGKKVVITHGQLPGDELEDRILAFKEKKYDILLSTTVIENGIDFSNVNTIFINECQSFGISQIHQLRGRVGRSDRQGYCYLLYRKEHLDGEAAKRIQTIVDYSYLGAGFELAMKDLEIRWWGDILGIRQSGQAKEIGVSLFLKMLEEKIEELKTNTDETSKAPSIQTQIDLMISASIPNSYFLSETDKLNFYREIELIESREDLEYLKNSFLENNTQDDIPLETQNLFLLLETQILAKKYKITHIKRVWINYQLDFDTSTTLEELKAFLKRDTNVIFSVVDITRLRTPTKGFENDIKFIEYLACILQWNVQNKKLRLVRKAHS